MSKVRFGVVIDGYYEVDEAFLLETYGTTDLDECAAIDAENDPAELVTFLEGDANVTIRPRGKGSTA